jgi:O-antigen/teichoic acid export membrane protein
MKLTQAMLFSAAPIMTAVFGFFTIPLMTWTMPASIISEFGLFQYTSSILLIIVTFGMEQAFLRELPVCNQPSLLLRRCLVLPITILVLGIFLTIFVFCNFNVFPQSYSGDGIWLFFICLTNVACLTIYKFGAQETRLDENGGGAYLLAEFFLRFPPFLFLIVLFSGFLLSYKQSIFILYIIGSGLAATVLVFRNRETWLGLFHIKEILNKPLLIELTKFSIPLAFSGVMYSMITSFGVYLTRWVYGEIYTSKLVVAISLSNIAVIGQAIFSLLWAPIMYKTMDSSPESKRIGILAEKTCVGAALIYSVVVCIIHLVQHLLNENFQGIAPLSSAFCVLPALYSVSEVTFFGLMLKRKSLSSMLATAIGFIATIVANILFVPILKDAGVSVAVALASFFFFAARTEFSCKYWEQFSRVKLYFGAASIMLSGVIGALTPPFLGPLNLIVIVPYLWFERGVVREQIKFCTSFCRKLNL